MAGLNVLYYFSKLKYFRNVTKIFEMGSPAPSCNVAVNYYRIKDPTVAFNNMRYWDLGRKYDLLRCISTLIYVRPYFTLSL